MTQNFARTAAQLAGIVPASIGWTPDQFWNATPAELVAIFSAHADVAGEAGASPLSKTQFEKLKEDHPDDELD